MRECFFGSHSVPATHGNVLGVLSLIIYSLLLVISIKYIAIVMRADNQGEGGILALTALLPQGEGNRPRWPVLILLGIFGAALLYGDGMITPAITVLGAIEGLKVATPFFDPYVVPVAVVILIGVFAIQRHGTHRVGRLFGPIMVVWFVAIAVLGYRPDGSAAGRAHSDRSASRVLVLPRTRVARLRGARRGLPGGHRRRSALRRHGAFWKSPIRYAWFGLVLPALLLNYFGQGALLLSNPAAAEQPFFLLAPGWASAADGGVGDRGGDHRVPGAHLRRVLPHTAGDSARILSTARYRAHIAPRNGSGLRAANQLGADAQHDRHRDRVRLVDRARGRIRHRGDLTMVITAVLLQVVATERWGWPTAVAYAVTGVFLTIDLAFFGANALKIAHGGWLPLVIGGLLFTFMTTWKTGRQIVAARLTARAVPIEEFLASVAKTRPARVPGTAVFMTAQPRGTPAALAHNLRYNKVLHAHVVTLMVTTQPVPHVPEDQRVRRSSAWSRASPTSSCATGSWRIRTCLRLWLVRKSRGSKWTRTMSPIFSGAKP